jgi:4-amino-4-deoxy-L-arabinose transferase-like glycosyltransferase
MSARIEGALLSYSGWTRWGLLLLCTVWLLTGLIGHVPWKGPDGDQFAALLWARHSHDWLIPAVAGSADLSGGPLYTWLAGLLSFILSPLMPMHDAARLTSGFAVAFSAWMLAMTARRLYGEEAGWAAVLMLLGCLGLLLPAHSMDSHMTQLAGMSAVLYGLTDMLTHARRGGATAGLGLAAMGLSTGWLEPVSLLPLVIVLPVMLAQYRSPKVWRGMAILLLSSLAVLGLWIALLSRHEGHLLAAWWRDARQSLVFAAPSTSDYEPGYILKNLVWAAWPAWPVALWALYRMRTSVSSPASLMPLLAFAFPCLVLSLTVHPDEVSITPLLPPIALLGAGGLLGLRRGAAYALLWFGVMLFSLLMVVGWAYYSAWQFGFPAPMAHKLATLGVTPPHSLNYPALTAGIMITLGWFGLTPKIRRSAIRPMLVWDLGLCVVWLQIALLAGGVLDHRQGYAEMASRLERVASNAQCIATRGMPLTVRALLQYHTGIDFTPFEKKCNWLMVYTKRNGVPLVDRHWRKKWEGSRPGDWNEHFWLYETARKGGAH